MTEKEKLKLERYDPRGVQTLFRTVLRNHYNLLRMVDNKSSIILTINSIIFSLLMGAIYIAPATEIAVLEFGVKTLMKFCFASMIIALFGMLPHRYLGRSYQKSSYKGLLYSQNFSELSLEDYKKEMKIVLDSGERIYEELLNDLYFLGKAIAIKQRLVLLSFIVFLCGLIFIGVYITYYNLSDFGVN